MPGPQSNRQAGAALVITGPTTSGRSCLPRHSLPHLPFGANIVFTATGVEDPKRMLAKAAGCRGGRYLSAEASARGDWVTKRGASVHWINGHQTSLGRI
jgi:hypothetical protein